MNPTPVIITLIAAALLGCGKPSPADTEIKRYAQDKLPAEVRKLVQRTHLEVFPVEGGKCDIKLKFTIVQAEDTFTEVSISPLLKQQGWDQEPYQRAAANARAGFPLAAAARFSAEYSPPNAPKRRQLVKVSSKRGSEFEIYASTTATKQVDIWTFTDLKIEKFTMPTGLQRNELQADPVEVDTQAAKDYVTQTVAYQRAFMAKYQEFSEVLELERVAAAKAAEDKRRQDMEAQAKIRREAEEAKVRARQAATARMLEQFNKSFGPGRVYKATLVARDGRLLGEYVLQFNSLDAQTLVVKAGLQLANNPSAAAEMAGSLTLEPTMPQAYPLVLKGLAPKLVERSARFVGVSAGVPFELRFRIDGEEIQATTIVGNFRLVPSGAN